MHFIIFLLPLGSRVPTNGLQMKGCSLLMQKSDQGRQDTKAKCGKAEHFGGLWEFGLHHQWARREEVYQTVQFIYINFFFYE